MKCNGIYITKTNYDKNKNSLSLCLRVDFEFYKIINSVEMFQEVWGGQGGLSVQQERRGWMYVCNVVLDCELYCTVLLCTV